MQDLICYLTCKHCGGAVPVAISGDGVRWLHHQASPDVLESFFEVHGVCSSIETGRPDPSPFLLTYSAKKDEKPPNREPFPYTPEQEAEIEQLRVKRENA